MFFDSDGPRVGRIVVALIVLVVLVPALVWGGRVALAPVFGWGDQQIITNTGEYRIANYEKFYNDCNAIVAQETVVTNAQNAVDREVKYPVDSFREQTLVTNLDAAVNTRANLIAQYNADADKDETRAKFLDSDLPYEINVNSPIGSVTCS